MTDDEEKELRRELLMADLELRRKQIAWETPRNIAIVVGAAVALAGLVFGVLGYKIGQTPPPPPVIINVPAPAQGSANGQGGATGGGAALGPH